LKKRRGEYIIRTVQMVSKRPVKEVKK